MVNRFAAYPWLILLLALFANTTLADFNSSVDRTVINQDETLTLTLIYDGQALLSEPDTEPLTHDFNILNNSRQQSFSNVNGVTESFTRWLLILEPKRDGKLIIPTLEYRGNVTDAIEITVNKAQPKQIGDPVFAEAEIDSKVVYQNQQALLKIRLAYAVPISNITLTDIGFDNVEVVKVNEAQFQKQFSNRSYNVIELTFALFPQQAGDIAIPSQTFTAYMSRNAYSSGKRIRVQTQPISLTVNPKPSNISLEDWIPSKGLSLRETWSDNSGTITVGEPITRTITMLGQGVLSNTLPDINWQESNRYRLYPDQPTLEDQTFNDGVLGKREQSIALVASEPGTLTLPAVKLSWFDVTTNRLSEVTLPERQILVVADPNALPVAPSSQPANKPEVSDNSPLVQSDAATGNASNSNANLYLWGLALSILVNLILLWLVIRKPSTGTAEPRQPSAAQNARQSEQHAFANLAAQSDQQQCKPYRSALSAWLATTESDWQILNWHQLNKALDDIGRTQLLALDKQLYDADASNCDLVLLHQSIAKLRENRLHQRQSGDSKLPPLYPHANS